MDFNPLSKYRGTKHLRYGTLKTNNGASHVAVLHNGSLSDHRSLGKDLVPSKKEIKITT